MGWGNHCAEVCKLTGLFLLNGIKNIIPDLEVGLYRDNGIVAINKNQSSVEVEKIKKTLHKFDKTKGKTDSQLRNQQQLLTTWI